MACAYYGTLIDNSIRFEFYVFDLSVSLQVKLQTKFHNGISYFIIKIGLTIYYCTSEILSKRDSFETNNSARVKSLLKCSENITVTICEKKNNNNISFNYLFP